MADTGIADRSVMLLLALPASGGGLAIMGKMTAVETIKTSATGLEDLLAINQVGHRGATHGWMRLLTVTTLRISF